MANVLGQPLVLQTDVFQQLLFVGSTHGVEGQSPVCFAIELTLESWHTA